MRLSNKIKRGESIMLRYKFDVLSRLKQDGYSTYKLSQQKIIAPKVIQKLRQGEIVGTKSLNILCGLLNCQISDIIEFIPDTPNTDIKKE